MQATMKVFYVNRIFETQWGTPIVERSKMLFETLRSVYQHFWSHVGLFWTKRNYF